MVYKSDPRFKYHYRLLTTRFTDDTMYELIRFKENNDMNDKCIYNIPIKLRYNNVSFEYPIMILEMNNTTNEIIGIGFTINRSDTNNLKYNIYSNKNYNRYTYKSRFHINLNKNSIDYKYYIKKNKNAKEIIEKLTNICFYGKGHLKRGSSFMCVPDKYITIELNEILMELFLKKYKRDNEILLNLTNFNKIKPETIQKILDSEI